MSKLVPSGSKYTDDIRKRAAVEYAVKGNLRAIERDLNIPNQTLNDWKKTEWWDEIVGQVRAENQDEHLAMYHEITRKALAKAESAIDGLTGDLTANDIKSLVVTGATATDKARLIMNQPTSIKGDSASMQSLADQFKELSKQWTEKQANVVSVQVQDD